MSSIRSTRPAARQTTPMIGTSRDLLRNLALLHVHGMTDGPGKSA
ncbi:MAG: hypothetical protein R2838_23125 [Caldilineaceae bacterium]